jgi:hypothetical protein
MALLEPPGSLLRLLQSSLPLSSENDNGDVAASSSVLDEEIVHYLAFLGAGLAEANEFESQTWNDVMSPYLLQQTLPWKDNNDDVIERFRAATEQAYTNPDDAESYGDPKTNTPKNCAICDSISHTGVKYYSIKRTCVYYGDVDMHWWVKMGSEKPP